MATRKRTASELLPPVVIRKPRPALGKPIEPGGATDNYPWDSYQDRIVVNSIELSYPQRCVGVKHYLHLLGQQEGYKHICFDFANDMNVQTAEDSFAYLDDNIEEVDDDGPEREAIIDYTIAPSPPVSRSTYNQPIYAAQTYNPALFLAVLRIAQHNLPFLCFASALRHLPNVPPTHLLAHPPPSTFVDSLPHTPRATDTKHTLVFLPRFYADTRHALGFYTLVPDPVQPGRNWATSCVFTPCTTRDLVHWNMIEFGSGRGMVTRESGVVVQWEGVRAVGSTRGRWVEHTVVEDWQTWNTTFRIATVVWEKRLEASKGVEEGGRRRKGV